MSDGVWRLILGAGAGAADADEADALAPVAADGPTNMAIDQALLQSVAAGGTPVLRLYRWAPPTLSFGRNQPARGLYDTASAAGRGIDFVRRPTGGQAVLHDDELTYAVVAPVAVVGRPRTAYRRINEALVSGLRGLGVAAGAVADAGDLTGRGGSASSPPAAGGRSWAEACFQRPERGEVVVGGRKLVGSAQRTESRTILQHGSILLGGTQAPAEELLLEGAGARGRAGVAAVGGVGRGGVPGWTTLEAELGRRPSLEELVEAVVGGFTAVLGTSLARSTLASAESSAVGHLRSRFTSGGWTWRR